MILTAGQSRGMKGKRLQRIKVLLLISGVAKRESGRWVLFDAQLRVRLMIYRPTPRPLVIHDVIQSITPLLLLWTHVFLIGLS